MGEQLIIKPDGRRRRQNRIDAAMRAEGSDPLCAVSSFQRWAVDPVLDLSRVKNPTTVETSGALASREEISMVIAIPVYGLQIELISHTEKVG